MNLHPLVAARLLLRFLVQCVLSGVSTGRIILQRGRSSAGLVRMPYAPMSETGAAVLGAMVTLTPGSSVIDIDIDRREMLLHLLDVEGAESTIAAIRGDFERDLCVLFPEVQT
jgi:multicomponent K+:H+ antiporter subunit E/multicomponent Na+:H+ antiporter subunit E